MFANVDLELHVFLTWTVSAFILALFMISGYCFLKVSGFPVVSLVPHIECQPGRSPASVAALVHSQL